MIKYLVLSVLTLAVSGSIQSVCCEPLLSEPKSASDINSTKTKVLSGRVSTTVRDAAQPWRTTIVSWNGRLIEFREKEKKIKHSDRLKCNLNSGLGFIGIQYVFDKKKPVISRVFASMPAQQAELKAGDIIESVDGKSTKGLKPRSVLKMIVGEPGQPVRLVLLSNGEHREVSIIRVNGNDIPDSAERMEFANAVQSSDFFAP